MPLAKVSRSDRPRGRPSWRRAGLGFASASLGALAGLSLLATHACDDASPGSAASDASTGACPQEECKCKIDDPTEHCVKLEGCGSDRDCPAGTICLPASDIETPLVPPLDRCVPPSAGRTRCRASPEAFDRALIDGFRVNDFLVEPIAETSSFSLSPPPEARFVACALFGCRPYVEILSETDLAGGPMGTIINYEQCALSGEPQLYSVNEESTTSGVSLVFTPSVDDTEFWPADRDGGHPCSKVPADASLPKRKRQLTELGVGCWAYDESRLIAASRVAPVPADQIANLSNIASVLSKDCKATPKQLGMSCLLDGSDPPLVNAPRFGACFDGKCRPRCVTAADCPEVAATKDWPEPAAACIHDAPSSFVGVCEYTRDRSSAAEAGAGGGGP